MLSPDHGLNVDTFDVGLCLRETESRILFAMKFDGCNFFARIFGQALHFQGYTRGYGDALVFE
jgi:hypothetical protein